MSASATTTAYLRDRAGKALREAEYQRKRAERLGRENARLRAREQDASAPANKTPARPRTRRVLVLDDSTDGATGSCRCGACGCSIEPSDAFCRRCGAEMEG